MHVAVKHTGTHSRKGEQASTRVEGIRGQRHATETSGLDVPTKQSRCHGRRQDVANGFLRNDAWRVVGIRGQVKPFLFDRSLDFTNQALPEFRAVMIQFVLERSGVNLLRPVVGRCRKVSRSHVFFCLLEHRS